MSRSGPEGRPGEHEVGSVGEEAARLFDAFTEALGRGGARDHDGAGHGAGHGVGHGVGPDEPGGAAGPAPWEGLVDLASEAVDALRGAEDHIATGAPECRWCPVCRTLHLVRETSPEVRTHLLSAARSLLAATTVLLERADRDEAGRAAPGVERIDLDPDAGGRQEARPSGAPDQHEEEHW